MGKQQYLISEFKGLDTSAKMPGAPIWLQGAKANTDDSVLVPENADVVVEHSGACIIQRKKIYADGYERELSVTDTGSVFIDDEFVGTVDTDNLSIDVIGRQAILCHGGYAKILRVGYPGNGFIPFTNDEIIFENDYLTSGTSSFTNIKDAIPLSETQAIVLINGRSNLTMFNLGSAVVTQTESPPICPSEIVAITHDVNASGNIENIYCAYYQDAQIHIKRLTINQDNFDISAVSEPILLKDDEEYFASGYTLKNIAKTNNKIFISLYKQSGNTAEMLGPGTGNISQEQDLLFAFDDISIDWSNGAIINTTGDNLARSMLPWNPYKPEKFAYKTWNGVFTESDAPSDYINIPYETNIGLGVNSGNPEFDKSFLIQYLLQTVLISGTTPLSLPIPGCCGALGHIRPMGDLVVIDYANNCVGYFVYAEVPGSLPTSHTTNEMGYLSIENNGYRNHGAGEIIIEFDGKRTIRSSAIAPADDNTCVEPISMLRRIALYCWNGVYKGNAQYEYWLANYSGDEIYVNIDRYFDDLNTRNGDSDAHMRFALVGKDALLSGITPTGLHWAPILLSSEIRSIISTTDDPSSIVVPYDDDEYIFSPLNSNIGIREINSHSEYPQVIDSNSFCKVFSLSRSISFSGAQNIVSINNISGWTNIHELSGISQGSDGSSYSYEQAGLSAEYDTSGDGYAANAIVRMKMAFVFDGVSVSPLSESYVEVTHSAAFNIRYQLSVGMDSLRGISRRITAINVYSAEYEDGEALELYRLVKSFPVTKENFFINSEGIYETGYQYDTNAKLASFNADSGYSESVDTVSIARELQCTCQNYLFVGNVDISSKYFSGVNTDNLVIRSLPFQPSVFNYQEDFVVLEYTPTALVTHNNRIYAFGNDRYSIINPDTLSVEHTSFSCGAANKHHVVVCDYGVFVYYSKNVYYIDGQRVSSIGDSIRYNNNEVINSNYSYDSSLIACYPYSLQKINPKRELFIEYAPSQQEIMLVFHYNASLIGMFTYSIPKNKWCYYWLKPPAGDRTGGVVEYATHILSVYRYGDAVYAVYNDNPTKYTINIFGANTKRFMAAVWDIKTGNDRQDMIVYNGTVTKDGKNVSCALYGVIDSMNNYLLNTERNTPIYGHKLAVTLISNAPVDRIGITHRTKVTK